MPATPARAGFTLDGAGFTVDGRVLLAPLSLSMHAGRFYGLIGHNGSGKSTLLKLLARQQAPTTGSLHLDGRDITGWGARAFARSVAYLPQTTATGHGLTVRELVGFGRYPWHGALGRPGKADLLAVSEALVLCGLEPFAERLVDTLSGGERQRAWIAMLVAQDADHLLLDEPISALDLAQQVEVLRLVSALAQERGKGVVAVLHDVNMAARFCDEILALRGGALVARGTPADLMREDVLARIYGIPMLVMPNPAGGPPLGLAL